jgi:hypothetical protein
MLTASGAFNGKGRPFGPGQIAWSGCHPVRVIYPNGHSGEFARNYERPRRSCRNALAKRSAIEIARLTHHCLFDLYILTCLTPSTAREVVDQLVDSGVDSVRPLVPGLRVNLSKSAASPLGSTADARSHRTGRRFATARHPNTPAAALTGRKTADSSLQKPFCCLQINSFKTFDEASICRRQNIGRLLIASLAQP